MTTIKSVLAQAAQRLAAHESVLGRDRAHLHAWPDKELEPVQCERFERLIRRRVAGEPVAHLTGEREFWSLPLAVTVDTLIPRPDTERLVELALERLPPGAPCRIADLGTGSGAIALALASERPDCRITATDRSPAALAVAARNARRLALTNVEFLHGDWCEALGSRRFHLIAANPPYICANDPHLGRGDLRFEPREALLSGSDGLDAIRRIAACALAHLEAGGWLLVEHGFEQGAAAHEIFRAAGLDPVEVFTDAAGHDRVCTGRAPT
ncbi:MAG: peptide chain release factor N(5)-glutamine methyltransferase [Gammaproteobacteria bacterium]